MDRPFADPRDDDFIDLLSKPDLDGAVDALRHLQFFHTMDVVEDFNVRSVHRADAHHPDFRARVEAWLIHHQVRLGLRGPLPGHPALGARWGFYDDDSNPAR
ncbi:MAG: hypothetical protein EP329_20590 [Deltaproteobacteria bacterium]|nr:MAG: hypothetical protein EP329_20590 [Deltaproteobacteria bacterium]